MNETMDQTVSVKEAENEAPCIRRKIDGRVYTVKIHFRKDASRTAKETMKSVLVHVLDSKSVSWGESNGELIENLPKSC